MRSLLYGAYNGSVSTSSASYIFPNGRSASLFSENYRKLVVSSSGTLSNFLVRIGAAPGVGKSYTFRVRVNGANSTIVVTISGTDTTGSDTTNSVSISPGDTISLSSTPSGTPASTLSVHTSLEFSGSTANESMLLGSTGGNQHGSFGPYYSCLTAAFSQSNQTITGEEDTVVAIAGTLKNLYIDIQTAPGAGKSRTFTVMLNNVATSLSCTISDTGTTASDTTNTVDVVPGDIIYLKDTTSGSPTLSLGIKSAVTFVSSVDGKFHIVGIIGNSIESTTNTVYLPLASAQAASIACGVTDETQTSILTNGVLIEALYIKREIAPGTGKSRAYTVRKNASDTSVTCTMSDLSLTASDTAHSVYFTDGDLISISNVPTNTPSAANETFYSLAATMVNVELSDSLSIAEDITLQISGTFNIDINDTLAVSEDVSLVTDLLLDISDTLTISESVTAENTTLGGISVVDTSTISETVTVEFIRSRGKIWMRSTGQTYPLPMDDRRVI